MGPEPNARPFSPLQGQYLAFIYAYPIIHSRAPAERELQDFFRVTPPVVHQMIVSLAAKGFLHREPGQARSLKVLLPPEILPVLVRK
jgi:DNA-binding MarR family transcriptional regulator